MKIGDKFRLISRDEVFTVVRVYLAAGSIPSVVGRNRRHQTCARIADILAIPKGHISKNSELHAKKNYSAYRCK